MGEVINNPNIYLVANVLVGLGMLSIASALFIGLYKRAAQYKWLSLLFMGLFATAAFSRFFKAWEMPPRYLIAELILDVVSAVVALTAGIIIWPILRKAIRLPSYAQVTAANEGLNYYKQLFEIFMDNSPMLAWLKDENGKLIYVNDALARSMGYTREDLLGKTSFDVSPLETAEQITANDQKVMTSGEVLEVLEYAHGSSGQVEPFWSIKFPVPRKFGAAIGGISLNVSDKFRATETQSQLAAIVESSQDAIIAKDLDGNITSWNNGAEEMYGYKADEVLGKSISILVPPERKNEVPEILDKIRRGIRVSDYETVRVGKQGQLIDVSISISPIRTPTGEITGAAVIARDITLIKRNHAEIEDLNRQLKERVYELAEANAALQAARDQALEASNLKSAFCANISHELRTPLAGILGLNEILLGSSALPSDAAQLAGMVQESAEALLLVVNDILDLSKIEAGKVILEYAPFDVRTLVDDCARLMAAPAKNKGLTYEVFIDSRVPATVYGDQSRIRQVLLNLIGNAVKFTSVGGVKIQVQPMELSEENVELEFCVIDTGIGIAQEDVKYLFMPFGQVDNSSTRQFGGTGLGLTISKRFVEMMGGKIGLRSEPGKGSTFWFRLPLDRVRLHSSQRIEADIIARPAVEPIPRELALGRKVLVVEDNGVLQQLALRQLSTLGIEAEATVFGREAIDKAMSNDFDVILMDINLPDINGLEATAAIRNLEQSARRPEIPIIAMTAGAMKGDRERSLASGMNDYLAKPVAIEDLKITLERWLARSQVRQYFYPPSTPSPEGLQGGPGMTGSEPGHGAGGAR